MAERHSLLASQVRHFFGDEEAVPEPWRAFLDAVDDAYRQADEGRREMGALGHLVGSLAHEVRNPLFAISGIVEALLAADDAEPQQLRCSLEVLKEPIARLFELMSELLEYGKPFSRNLAEGSLNEVALKAVADGQTLAEQRGVRLVTSLAEPELAVRMIRPRLLMALGNLVQNALQHTPPGGSVALALEEVRDADRAWARCVVRDSGSGFRPEDLTRVFEPFFTRRRGGTGLGLSIVQRVVDEHLGKVAAGNRPSGGAVVTVDLPLCRPAAVKADPAASAVLADLQAPGWAAASAGSAVSAARSDDTTSATAESD
jgi:signal transduction histidine kinase